MSQPEDLKTAASHHSGEYADYRENLDVTQVHAAVEREHREPEVGVVPVPVWLMAVSGVALFAAGAYLGMFNGGFRGDVYNERESSAGTLFEEKAIAGGGAETAAVAQDPKVLGQKLYGLTCQSCHQPAGTGSPGSIPPLAKSEWVNGGSKRFLMIVLKGVVGPIDVAGGHYNNPAMVGWENNPAVKDEKKLAAILTYVRSAWGNTGSPISAEQIAAAKKEFANQKPQYPVAEVTAVPADAEVSGGAGDAAPAKAP